MWSTLYGVVHVPFPVIFMGIAERHGDTALRGNGMGAGREEDFREQRTGLTLWGNLQRRAPAPAQSQQHQIL